MIRWSLHPRDGHAAAPPLSDAKAALTDDDVHHRDSDALNGFSHSHGSRRLALQLLSLSSSLRSLPLWALLLLTALLSSACTIVLSRIAGGTEQLHCSSSCSSVASSSLLALPLSLPLLPPSAAPSVWEFSGDCVLYGYGESACPEPAVSVDAVRHMDVAMAACGDSEVVMSDALVSIKSWLLQRRPHVVLHVHLILDEMTEANFTGRSASFQAVVNGWPALYTRPEVFRLLFYNVRQLDKRLHRFLRRFKRCSTARLFVHRLLPQSLDAVVYVDADTVAVSDTRRLWAEFQSFSPTRFIGLSWEAHNHSWYTDRFRDSFPWPRPWGINAGVILLNLTRLRSYRREVDASVKGVFVVANDKISKDGSVGRVISQGWDEVVRSIFAEYAGRFKFGDQDMLNVLAGQDTQYRLWQPIPATYNWRAGMMAEPPGLDRGLTIVHGNCGGFHSPSLELLGLHGKESPYVGLYQWINKSLDWKIELSAPKDPAPESR